MSINLLNILTSQQTPAEPPASTNPIEVTTADLNEVHPLSQSRSGSLGNLQLHPCFSHQNPGRCPGTVEIIVGRTTFLVHKQIMIHASPFFESILTGDWAETRVELNSPNEREEEELAAAHLDQVSDYNSLTSLSQRSTIPSQLNTRRVISHHRQTTTNDEFDSEFPIPSSDPPLPTTPLPDSNLQHDELLDLSLPRIPTAQSLPSTPLRQKPPSSSSRPPLNDPPPPLLRTLVNHSHSPRIEARIYLKEERSTSFQDLLMFVYPHLECVCTWHNASDLMTMSQKFDMPLLKRHVLSFLLSSVAGKPIEAMKIAEEHQLPELYRESSRFLLDNWQGWDHKELESLSSETLLKLEKRRTWFLERLLKLGLVNSSRDYVCPPSCPDPQHCTKLVDDKWRSAWAASFKFGPPQPSSVYRALRCLEPSLHSPALLLPHTSCQQHALRFFADLFDRMFSQFTPRGGGGGGSNGGTNGNVTSGLTASHSASASSGANPLLTSTANSPDQPPPPSQQQQQQPQPQQHQHAVGLAQSHPPISIPPNPITGFSSLNINSGLSSNFLNSDKTIRKAKYFLHVELFESSEKLRKRID
ncbi:hypothetical protein PCASD_17242 [Puccinia coronata f. sp. avenae]|uniref:BTB domain-containing protein n=1 Tax=Puccinia coronata f. sp. avenae TaxID=200324 RepID=A0A2N5T9Q6_9BASI|nr:hypothetical protein PCASD_17242 [Puccinia coronata f. sp. avenae]